MQQQEYRDDYLSSAHWRGFRKKYRSQRSWCCAITGCDAKKLDLHHLTYKRLGRERLEDCIPLCRVHHDQTHQFVDLGVKLKVAHLRVGKISETTPAPRERKKRPPRQPRKRLRRTRRATQVIEAPSRKLYSEVKRLVLEPLPASERESSEGALQRKTRERDAKRLLRRRTERPR